MKKTIVATAAAVSLYLQIALKWNSDDPRGFAYIMLVTVGVTTVAWLAVTSEGRVERKHTKRTAISPEA